MPDERQVKVAASPINWRNDDFPILGSETSVDHILGDMQKAGYDGTELGATFPADPGEIRDLLASYNLELAGGWFSAYLLTRDADEECQRFKTFAEFLKAAGAKQITTAEASHCPFKSFGSNARDQHYGSLTTPLFPSQLPVLTYKDWSRLAKGMSRLSEIAHDHGLTLGYHPHIQTVVENEQQLAILAGEAPELKFTIDTGHLALSGADPAAVLEKYIDRTVHVHVKNVRRRVADAAREGRMGFAFAVIEGVFTVPGDGGNDYPRIFKTMRDHNYKGWIVVEAEQNPLTSEPYIYATLARQYIRRTAGW